MPGPTGDSPPIEDYGLIGDMQTAALVSRGGSVDWLCLPRFDSDACFAALLGDAGHGQWRICPTAAEGPPSRRGTVSREYEGDSLILVTTWDTGSGVVTVTDFMPPRGGELPVLVRIVEGVHGAVEMECALRLRFGYGQIVPWARRVDGQISAVAGPDSVWLQTPVKIVGRNLAHEAGFTVRAGDRVTFALAWQPSHLPPPPQADPAGLLELTRQYWADWVAQCSYHGGHRDAVVRSLITLKALTYAPTGGIVAAPTTSLPEDLGGVRNWDYRYCWLRDATITLEALLRTGYIAEAAAWRDWLARTIAGRADDVQIMYGVAGERRLAEWEAAWLPGYAGSAPVRIGNAAVNQSQLDVYGEVIDALSLARQAGLAFDRHAWSLTRKLLEYLEHNWDAPDEGIWEVRGPRRHFVHSKVMAWVAFDRAVRLGELNGSGPVAHWRSVRDKIHAEVCERGYDTARGTFTQYYGSQELDAAVLLIPEVGFLPPDDERVVSTVATIQRDLMRDGLVLRYTLPPAAGAAPGGAGEAAAGTAGAAGSSNVDGLPGSEGAFLACSFWLVNALFLTGQQRQAAELFERLLALRNDLGLLAEEYDPRYGCQVGNFPQAFSHMPLIVAALNLGQHAGQHSRRPG